MKLNAYACPTVFEICTKQTTNTADTNHINAYDDGQAAVNTEKSQNDQLNIELVKLKLAHDIDVQMYKSRIQALENQCEEKRDKLQLIRNELGREKLKNKRLEALNKELRGNHIASTSIENVNSLLIYHYIFRFN